MRRSTFTKLDSTNIFLEEFFRLENIRSFVFQNKYYGQEERGASFSDWFLNPWGGSDAPCDWFTSNEEGEGDASNN